MFIYFQVGLSGKDLFTYNPDLIGQDDDNDMEGGVMFERDLINEFSGEQNEVVVQFR